MWRSHGLFHICLLAKVEFKTHIYSKFTSTEKWRLFDFFSIIINLLKVETTGLFNLYKLLEEEIIWFIQCYLSTEWGPRGLLSLVWHIFQLFCFGPHTAATQFIHATFTVGGVVVAWIKTLFKRGLQRDVVYLCWLIAPSANEYSCAHHVTWSPNKLWRSTSKFNLCCTSSLYGEKIWLTKVGFTWLYVVYRTELVWKA
jgi:hypothetical protein